MASALETRKCSFETVFNSTFFVSDKLLGERRTRAVVQRSTMWLLIPILLYTLVYMYVRHVYSYWKRKGYPTERTGPSWRFLKQVYKREFNHVNAVTEAYGTGGLLPFLGIYFFFRPTLLVRDVTLARSIFESSNSHFNDSKWDHVIGYRRINLLEKLAPIFTVSRLEGMFPNIEKVGDHLLKHLQAITIEHETTDVDMQSVLRTYAINVMGNLIYGLDSNSFEQRDCIFSKYVSKSLRSRSFSSYSLNHLPKKSSLTYRLRDIIKESVEQREDSGCIRKDVLQLLVKFRNANDITKAAKQNWHIENVFEREKVLSIKKLSKVAEKFLQMGLQTVPSTAVLTLFEVLQEPYMLQKLLEEINNVKNTLQSNDKNLGYAELDSLKYMDLCIQETIRKYPAVPIVERVCSKDYNIPCSRFTISEGKTVMIPLMALQRDERYFDEPLRYKPERFLEPHKAKDHEEYRGYSLATETCVAQKFSKVVIKVALIKILEHFSLEIIKGKKLTLTHSPAPIITSREGLKVKLRSREINTKF